MTSISVETTTRRTWVEKAADLPLAFSQVREDCRLDLELVDQIPHPADVFMIASGGCTLAALAGSCKTASIHAVDINSAQLALCRLKLHLLANCDSQTRLCILGHQYLAAEDRAKYLMHYFAKLDLLADALGPMDYVAEFGPDYAGRYELIFRILQAELSTVTDKVEELLSLNDVTAQRKKLEQSPILKASLAQAFERAMDDGALARIFGEGALQNRLQPFARHFYMQTMRAFQSLPARTNPYLNQMLAGNYGDGNPIPWLCMPPIVPTAKIILEENTAFNALSTTRRTYDLIHLSNVLDWLSSTQAEELLSVAWSRLNPAGLIVIRQLNSDLQIRTLGKNFVWLSDKSEEALADDLSFFYRAVHIGVKKLGRQ